MNRYSVLPFSGANFKNNQDKLKSGESPCAICGRMVASPYKHYAVVVGGGDWARTREEEKDESDAGYMGEWGIGPDCHRKYLIKELLFSWVDNGFYVLVPKARGEGYLKTPYGPGDDRALIAIGNLVQCDVTGAEGALWFDCSSNVFNGGDNVRAQFESKVVPALEEHYSMVSRRVEAQEYWEMNPAAVAQVK
jgi:hypothetical protein